MDYPVIIVGAGQAGLATAYYLRRAKIPALILDNQPGPGAAWRHTWPSMTLFSTAEFSNLPGWPMPPYLDAAGRPAYPDAAHVIDYFRRYEQRYDLNVLRPVQVTAVDYDSNNGEFIVDAHSLPDASAPTAPPAPPAPLTLRAKHVVAATGTRSRPFVPSYPGIFAGTQWHSANYPGPEPFLGARVAVVGGANSGAQIAAELADALPAGNVTWYTQRPPRWMPDDIDGRALFHRSRVRALSILKGEGDPGADSSLGDIVMLPQVKRMRDSGVLTATPIFRTLDEVDADHLIWCTGFRPALTPFRELLRGRTPTVPGLHLIGYGDWTGPGSATITGVGPFAKAIAGDIARDLAAK